MYISSLNWCTARLYNKLALPTWAHSPIHLASYLISSCVYNFRQLFWSIALRFSQHTWLLLTMPKKGAAAQQRRKKLLISTRLIIRPKTRIKMKFKMFLLCSFRLHSRFSQTWWLIPLQRFQKLGYVSIQYHQNLFSSYFSSPRLPRLFYVIK